MKDALEQKEAFIFDCDGTLVDTMPIHFQAWTRAMNEVGLEFPEKKFYDLGGVPTVEIIKLLSHEQKVQVDAIETAEKKERYFEEFQKEVKPILPVYEIIKQYRGKVKMGVATGSIRVLAEKSLRFAGLDHYFETLVTSEDVKNHKPNPDVFLKAAENLKVNPKKCVGFEDTDIGLEAIQRAGMIAIDIRKLL